MQLTTNEVAEKVKLTPSRIAQLIRSKIIKADKRGRDWLIDESQIAIILSLPENRGKYERNKS